MTSNLTRYLIGTIIVLFVLLGVVISCQNTQIHKLKAQNAVLTESERLYKNNTKVLGEQAQYWKTKDSISVVTVGLINADKELFKNQYKELDAKFNNLIKDYSKKVQRETYLEGQIKIKDQFIANLKPGQPGSTYIKNDSTIVVNDSMNVDSRNYKWTTGSIALKLDSNKIRQANISLITQQAIGVDLAMYKDAKGIDRVSFGTKYPNANLTISGINDIEKTMQDYKKLAESKNKKTGRIGLGLNFGYGYTVQGNTIIGGPYLGLGFSYNLIRLK